MIIVKKLSKKFHDDHYALMDISFATEERPTVIVGDVDSGKTTLLNIIAGLDENYEGEVFIDGKERRELKNDELRISYLTQEPTLFLWKSVYKNLEYVFKVEDKKFDKLAAREKIKEVAEEFGLIGCLSRRVGRLNDFEKKLVCLARVALKQSTILLVDEPFFNLTQFEISSLWQAVLSLMSKLSCDLIVTDKGQNMAYFEGCDVLKINFGTKVE